MNTLKSSVLLIILTLICHACDSNTKTEKYQHKRNKVVNVKDKIEEIRMDSVLIGSTARLFLSEKYLIIGDHKSEDKLIRIFDRKLFSYLTSIVNKGQGPNEVTVMGNIAADDINNKLYISDHGKQKIFSYDLDSIFIDSPYLLKTKMEMKKTQFPDKYQYVNDTLCMGLIIEPIGNYDYKQSVAKWDMTSGEISIMSYVHPKIKKKRIRFAVSFQKGIYVEAYSYYDLLTICGVDGNLKCNIYGPNWSSSSNVKGTKIHHYGKVTFCKDKIIAAYSGGNNLTDEYYPTKFHIFDMSGNYLKTIETGYRIADYCSDEHNNRLIMNFEDVIQFGYLNLDGILD